MTDYVSPDARRRIATGLMAAQYDRATPEEGNVTQRHGLLPLATYDNGRTGLAFPGFVADPLESWGRLLKNGYQGGTGDTQGVEDAFNVAGAAMLGGFAAPNLRNVVGSAGGELKGAATGAIPDTPGIRAYHGSPHDFDRFDIGKVNESGRMQHGWGLNFATAGSGFKPEGAKHYGSNVYEVNLKVNPDELLKIDEPLKNQPQSIQKLFGQWRLPDEPIGKATSHAMAEVLQGIGIKGQTDGGVVAVFDDKLIEILRKYGLLGMAGGAAAAEYGTQNPMLPPRPASPQYRPGDA